MIISDSFVDWYLLNRTTNIINSEPIDNSAIKRDAFIADEDTQGIITNKKLILANTASRLVKKAKTIIKNVESGRFPF
jgi:hypothetical protein